MNQLFALTRHRKLFQTLVLGACILGLCSFAAAKQPTIITFDPPGSVYTSVDDINPSGTIVGWYLDANYVVHGFWRTPDGKITSYDAPCAGKNSPQGTELTSINPSGTIGGTCLDSNNIFHGFLLTKQGKYTVVDAPDAGTGHGQGTQLWNINESGDAAGMYINTGDNLQGTEVWRGFFRAADGVITEFDAPGAGTGPGQGTDLAGADGLNASGAVTGASIDATNVYHGFVRSRNGDFTLFDPPGSADTFQSGINAGGDVSGSYIDSDGVNHGYIRAKQGRFTDINVPGAGTGSGQGTVADSIADGGAVAGYYVDAENVSHGFTRAPSGKITTFDAPGAGTSAGQGTGFLSANNPSGAVAGTYVDSNYVSHGFLRPQCDDDSESVAGPSLQ